MSNSDDCITNRGQDVRSGPAAPPPGTLPSAPLWRRLTAVGYDAILLIAVFFVVTAIVVATHRSAVASGAGWFQLLLGACGWLYFGWFWTHGGQTVGMRAWKVRVVTAAAPSIPVTWTRASLRYLAAWIPALPLAAPSAVVPDRWSVGAAFGAFALAFAVSFSREDRACWHDLLSGTKLCRWQ